ncbi:MAG: hypothetical protein Q7R45_12965 [Sulfuricaulis sp.]|nr:hypothetical protein [Sulfuricaulis sp.]
MLYRTLSRPELLRAPEGGDSGAAAPVAAPEPAAAPVEPPSGAISLGEAVARMRARRDQPETNSDPATPDGTGAGQTQSGDEPDAAPPEREPSGESEASDPAGEPPIEAPRSWPKADKELFDGLPRAAQQKLVDIDRLRELEIRRGQNEVAEQRRAVDAERQQAVTARQQYEAAIPNALTVLNNHLTTQYQDVQSWDDVQRMASEDPARYSEWSAMTQRAQALQGEYQALQERQYAEQVQQFNAYVTREDETFIAKAPEFANPEKAVKLQADVRDTLEDVGFKGDEIRAAWAGQPINIRDHRVQLLIRDAMRYRVAQKALKTSPPKVVQQVQRPGNASAKGERGAERVAALTQKLEHTGSIKDAVALYRARKPA